MHLTVWGFLVLRLQQCWQKQRVLSEHHVHVWERDEPCMHRTFWNIQELEGSVEGL